MMRHDLASIYEFSYLAIKRNHASLTDAASLPGADATLIANR
jgi:hypothetical protein